MITRLFHARLHSLLCVALVLFASGLRAAESKPFAHESSDLKPDSAIRFGKLSNGLKYAIAANSEPKGRASLRLLVEAGSFHETESQRGLAHFLEHMAFNGSTHYPPETLIEFFQRMGMNFGGDTNASTSFDRTLYLLELADTKEATLLEGLRVFSDYTSGLLLQPTQLDRERGIILSEKRARDSVAFRTYFAELEFVLPDTLLPKRFPIGLTEIIEKAPREEFVDYYDTWYRPELISVIAVGDFDPDLVEKRIKETFTPLTARAPSRPKPNLGKVAPQPGIHVHYHPESESPNTGISLSTIAPFAGEADTSANRLKYLPRSLAHAMLNRRFAILARKENATFLSARASASEQYNLLRELSLDVSAKADQWEAALATGEQELRRALEFGFQPGELDDVRAAYINSLEQSVNTAPTRRSPSLADEIASDILRDSVTTHPRDELALYRPALERITTEDCLAALREAWGSTHRYVLVNGNAVIPGGKDAIAAAYQKSKSVAVTAPIAETAATWAYTEFGPTGKVTSRDIVKDLEITRVTFENGVRLNLKKTAFEANRIFFTTRVGSGSITEPSNQRGLAFLAGGTFDAGGLGKHSTDELMRIFAGKTVSVDFRPFNDSFVFSGATNSRDLLLALQFLTAKITDPGYRPEALRQATKGIEQMFLGFAHTPNGPLALEISNLLASGDPRFGTPPKDVLLSRTLEEVKAWLTPQLQKGPIEIGIVGDMDIEETISAVAQTLGALPTRDSTPNLDALLKVSFPSTPFTKTYTIDSQIPKGLAVFYWPTTDSLNVHVNRRLNIMASIFADRLRLKLREEMGGTYSPSARSMASDVFPGYGYMTSSIDIDPTMSDKIVDAMKEIAGDMATHGVTEDELERAKLPALTSVRESARTNGYWLGNVVSRAQDKPEVLDWARSRESDMASISKADIDALTKAYLSPDRLSRAIIVPAAKRTSSL